MSFFSFLIEYYVWIMIVLLILVIGVIGFLVDSKLSKQEKENVNQEKANAGKVNDEISGSSVQDTSVVNSGVNVFSQTIEAPSTVQSQVVSQSVFPEPQPVVSPQGVVQQSTVAPVQSSQLNSVSQNSQSIFGPVQDPQVVGTSNVVSQSVFAPSSSTDSASSQVDSNVSNSNNVFTTNDSQTFDINSMFSNH